MSDFFAQRNPKRPLGQTTRGKTAPNRLRRVDHFLARYDPQLIRRRDGDFAGALFVDLGFGAAAITALESAMRLRRLNPRLTVLGVEIDPERVAAAQTLARPYLHFRQGGFNLPLQSNDNERETVRLIRAFNVLRQYAEADVAAAHTELGQYLLPGGLLIEGTSDPYGRLWVANLLRRRADILHPEALIFSTNFRWGFNPAQFQPVLPKNYIHRVRPGEAIFTFFQAWQTAYRAALPWRALGVRQVFLTAARSLAEAGYAIDRHKTWLRRGYLIWYQPSP